MKDIKDYLHLYLGCDAAIPNSIGKLEGFIEEVAYIRTPKENALNVVPFSNVQLILRRLEDMTEEEANKCDHLSDGIFTTFTSRAKEIHYLLSEHFDLFGLIDAGLAIDEKTL